MGLWEERPRVPAYQRQPREAGPAGSGMGPAPAGVPRQPGNATTPLAARQRALLPCFWGNRTLAAAFGRRWKATSGLPGHRGPGHPGRPRSGD